MYHNIIFYIRIWELVIFPKIEKNIDKISVKLLFFFFLRVRLTFLLIQCFLTISSTNVVTLVAKYCTFFSLLLNPINLETKNDHSSWRFQVTRSFHSWVSQAQPHLPHCGNHNIIHNKEVGLNYIISLKITEIPQEEGWKCEWISLDLPIKFH